MDKSESAIVIEDSDSTSPSLLLQHFSSTGVHKSSPQSNTKRNRSQSQNQDLPELLNKQSKSNLILQQKELTLYKKKLELQHEQLQLEKDQLELEISRSEE